MSRSYNTIHAEVEPATGIHFLDLNISRLASILLLRLMRMNHENL